MGAPKIKCPGCGAKNDTNSRRCRVCATLINMNVPEGGKSVAGQELGGSPSDDTFDPTAIQSQLRPKSQMFKSGGGLGARIAAAKGGEAPAAPAPSSGPSWSAPPAAETFTPMEFGPPPATAPAGFGPSGPVADFPEERFVPIDVPSRVEPVAGPSLYDAPAPQDFGAADETFVPQEFNVVKPDLPPLQVDDEEPFDPNALFRDTPGAF